MGLAQAFAADDLIVERTGFEPRDRLLDETLPGIPEEDPGVEDAAFLRRDRERLVKQKINKFGQVKKPIVHAEIRQDGARYSIFAVSVRMEEAG